MPALVIPLNEEQRTAKAREALLKTRIQAAYAELTRELEHYDDTLRLKKALADLSVAEINLALFWERLALAAERELVSLLSLDLTDEQRERVLLGLAWTGGAFAASWRRQTRRWSRIIAASTPQTAR